MHQIKTQYDIDQYIYIQNDDEIFLDLCKNVFSKDTLYYPVFLTNGLVDMKIVLNKAGYGRIAKNTKTKYIKNLAVICRHTITGSFEIYQHKSNNNQYMLKSNLLPSSCLSIFIDYTETELIKTYIYADGSKSINKIQLSPEII